MSPRVSNIQVKTDNKPIDFHGASFFIDPYPVYRQLREAKEPQWLEHKQFGSSSPGMWMFGRYDEVGSILKASSISKQIARVRAPEHRSPMDFNLLNQDPPVHTRLRNMVSHAFTPARIREMEPFIEKVVVKLIASMRTGSNVDFIADFAGPLPVMVLAELLGIPAKDQEMFRRCSSHIMVGYDSVIANTDLINKQQSAQRELAEYFNKLIAERAREPRDDLISSMVTAQEEQPKLTGNELIGMCIFFIVAGHETTTNLLGNGLLALLQNPEQFALLKKHPEYLQSAIEEMLRFDSPTQRGTFRITTEECTIGGKLLNAGEQICAVIGSANRDPDKFPDPDKFDITRTPNQHFAFGLGIHFCLGATLARAEARIAFRNIIETLPNIRLATQTPDWNKSTLFRGLRALPVNL